MTEKKFCDICDEEIQMRPVELDVRLEGPLEIGEKINILDQNSRYHFHRSCFKELGSKILEAVE